MNKFIRGALFLCMAGLLLPLGVLAQQHGNEWINYNQQYIKIPVAEEGIYKVTYQDLQNAGFPVGAVNPRNLQLFHRGKEQAIFVEGEGNNIFDPADFVLFYGQRNDGTQDRELYISPEAQPHPYYNLYSDTTAYFLTFNLTNQPGKRMAGFSENNTYGLAAEPFYLEERLQLFTSNYAAGLVHPYAGDYKTQLAYGDFGEGFSGGVIANGQAQDINFPDLQQQLSSGPKPKLEMVLVGRNNLERQISVLAGASTSSLATVHTATFTGGRHYKLSENIEWSSLAGGASVARVATDQGERVSVSYAKLTYARAWDMQGAYEKVFRLPAGTGDRRYIEVKNVPSTVKAYDITDPANIVRIGLRRPDASTVTAVLSNGTTARKLLFTGLETGVDAVKKVRFRQIAPSAHNYLLVSHANLRKSAGEYADPVKAYAAYRASAAGGGFDTLLFNIGQLYDQFSYGEVSPMAIRRLVTYMSAGGEPAYLFLVGKALSVYHNYYRSTTWNNENHDLVPTFGFPGADIPYTSHLKGSGYAPSFPVGRLGAGNPQEVANYLNKVKETESQSLNDLSRKSLVHLSGGSNASQAAQFKRYLKEFEEVAESPYLGGKVETISKSEDVVVQEIDITKQVNQGVGLITFFGHSTPDLSDIEIGFVSDDRAGYRNKGKYPCLLVNGCDAGNIFSTLATKTFGEDWIFTADRGALNVLAHSGVGYTNMLRYYSGKFYELAYSDSNFIAASVGAIQAEAVRRFLQMAGTNEIAIAQAQEMVLQGDPAVKLFGYEKADYETNNNQVFVSAYNLNEKVNLSADSFAVAIIARNFGRTYPDSLKVRVNVGMNGAAGTKTFVKQFPSPLYQDTLYFAIRSEELEGPGIYRFEVQLNPESEIEELNYTNNLASVETLLAYGGTLNLLPQEYALIQEPEPDLYFQGNDLFGKNLSYQLEIDTSAGFASGALKKFSLQGDVLLKHNSSLLATAAPDSVTYFWRTKLAENDTAWVGSSFTHVPAGGEGWTQRHSAQFKDNRLDGISVSAGREWTFDDISRRIEVITFGPSAPGTDYKEVELRIDEVGYILGGTLRYCRDNSINVVQLNKANLEPLVARLSGALAGESCGKIPKIINNFIEKDIVYGNNDDYNLEKFIAEVPDGDYVVLFSIGSVSYEQWPSSVKEQLLSLGADPDKLAGLTNGDPYILIGKKGGTLADATEVYADKNAASPPAAEQTITIDRTLEGKRVEANIETELIGPARDWKELACSLNTSAGDAFELQLIGLTSQMQEQLLLSITENNKIPLDISAGQFPYLKLRLRVKDEENLSPPQLKYWQVAYESLPEGVILPADSLTTRNTFDEGEHFNPGFRFINISKQEFTDSLQVSYASLNRTNSTATNDQLRIAAPAPADTTYFSLLINTDKQAGYNDLKVQVNPQLLPEVNYSNNIFESNNFYTVRKDTLQPLIDVAFDGLYINSGAIVSPTPLISIMLRDENRFKMIKDTTDLQVYLKKDCEGCDYERINLAGSNARWHPATDKQDFRIEFEPGSLADGTYTLQVQATDASGNRAGKEPYSISFVVITESSITKFYPYPNPFSTSTRFVFTVTGSEVPDDIKIQIMTVDGRVVREILKEELGPIRIGHNISEFAWDGRDQWGDQLANGVYLYKVYLRHSGDVFKDRETKGDKAFKEGFGKMYLLR
jgi:hypothetical protein